MPNFRYRGYRSDGSGVAGTIAADSERAALAGLKRDGIHPGELVPEDALPRKRFVFRRRIGLRELALLTRRLATLAAASVPVYEAIATLADQEPPGELRRVLGRLKERLAEGSTLARAMAEEPQVFDEGFVSMVAAGEASGALETVLERLADFLEDRERLRSRITTALAYPLLMVLVGSGVMFFLLAFVIPKIVMIFRDSKAALPLITRLLIGVSGLLQHWWWLLLLVTAAGVVAWRRLRRNETFREREDRLLLRLPLAGGLLRQQILGRFSRSLGLLLMSGVPVVKSMEIAGSVVVNRPYRAVLREAAEELVQGRSLSSALGASPLFPPMLVQMIAIGERGGELEQMLWRAGTAFEREFEARTTRLMALLEPCLILAMGLAVGFVVLAVLLPIFELNQLVR